MKIYPLFFLLILFFSCNNAVETFPKEEENHKEIPSDWFHAQRSYPSGKIDKKAFLQALKESRISTVQAAQRNPTAEWEFAGPTNIGGRVTDIEMPASSMDIMYFGAASGGVFKSIDGGNNFDPIFDDALSLSIGDIELAPSDENIIYVGTGEANAGGGSLAYDGVGVYRSDDAGNSWTHIGLENAGSIGKVKVHPTDPNTVYVATMGNLFSNDGQRGVFKSTDGGNSWNNILMVSDSTGVIDLTLHPDDPNIIYAAAWERIRRPQYRKYAGPTSGIFKSTDGGSSWTELTNGLPSDPLDKGRIGIAIAPSNSNILYAAYAGGDGFISGAFRSNDAGNNWFPINTFDLDDVPFMWWFGKIIVHPTDEDKVHYLSLNTFKSGNGGNNWEMIFQGQHVDQHALFIHPADPNFYVSGNDGGVYISQNEGVDYTFVNSLPITQFYGCEIDNQNPQSIYGGAQDNNTIRTLTGNVDDWEAIVGGDGMYPMVNPDNNNIIFAGYQNGFFFKSTNGGNNFSDATNGIVAWDRKNWNTPKIFDPNNSNIMYYGANRLYKSINGADSWNAISSDLTNGDPGGNLISGTITTISVSPLDSDVIWVGTDDGKISITTDGGGTWDSSSDIPNRWITSVAANPFAVSSAYATLSGFRYGENIGHVYKTNDDGITWDDISGNLPDVPVNDIIVHPILNDLYIATDVGVFVSKNDGQTWETYCVGLPNVVVTDLDFHEGTATLLAATYGRSMYKVVLEEETSVINFEAVDFKATVAPNPFSISSKLNLTVEKSGQYRIELFDISGKKIKLIFDGDLNKGEHQFLISDEGLTKGTFICNIYNSKNQRVSIQIIHQ